MTDQTVTPAEPGDVRAGTIYQPRPGHYKGALRQWTPPRQWRVIWTCSHAHGPLRQEAEACAQRHLEAQP